jgi:phytoene/squalene synthetase
LFAYRIISNMENANLDLGLAPSITKAASKQTYYTIRFLADRDRVADAYRAYAYFRWVDDILDAETISRPERSAFIQRQKSLLESCYRGELLCEASREEQMLIELVRCDTEKDSGLRCYLHNMMAVMDFDTERRGRLISQAELNRYTRCLARAVTEALHYFIGHHCMSPHDETRYLPVVAAHIIHMLRDTFDDLKAGYFNVPCEVLEANQISPQDLDSDAYRAWVRSRVELARLYFRAGKNYLCRVESLRYRLACLAYTARFECLLNTIENEDYFLRPHYNERKSLTSGLRMGWLLLSSMMDTRGMEISP